MLSVKYMDFIWDLRSCCIGLVQGSFYCGVVVCKRKYTNNIKNIFTNYRFGVNIFKNESDCNKILSEQIFVLCLTLIKI